MPLDIVSDRGPQFISQVWKSFCDDLGEPILHIAPWYSIPFGVFFN